METIDNIIYYAQPLFYIIVILTLCCIPCLILYILGMKLPTVKEWKAPKIVSVMLSGDIDEEIRQELDECEVKIS